MLTQLHLRETEAARYMAANNQQLPQAATATATACSTAAASSTAQLAAWGVAVAALSAAVAAVAEAVGADPQHGYSGGATSSSKPRAQVLAADKPRHTWARDDQALRHMEGPAPALSQQRHDAHWGQELLRTHHSAA